MSFDPSTIPFGPYTDFYTYWASLKKDHRGAPWSAFNLLDLAPLVPLLTIFDILSTTEDPGHKKPGARHVRIRFVGAEIITSQGEDTTGQFLSDMPNMTDVENRCLEVARSAEPYFASNQKLIWTDRNYRFYSTLGLPLTDDADRIDKVIYLMNFN
jgi:hypothetical protein